MISVLIRNCKIMQNNNLKRLKNNIKIYSKNINNYFQHLQNIWRLDKVKTILKIHSAIEIYN